MWKALYEKKREKCGVACQTILTQKCKQVNMSKKARKSDQSISKKTDV